ncbi:SET and MYND domain-containing protein 4-like [Culex quinquefasciatus]|uniref:SET and MYND domain-containing protein 4-like n=1 Tax=Culex quinquefasciatus TaxID=7176 RepID=UPI0018E30634|nr:SET and MYND domain-containing protein 4-like [Culex quinquefasciatus]
MNPNLLPPSTRVVLRACCHPGRLYAVQGIYAPASGSAAGSGTRQVRRRRGPLRNTGNRLYLDGKYGEALVWCFAEKETNRLATGYGNRSVVYFEQGEYAFALYNIDLAKKHDYPEKLMPKLRVMELNCKHQIAAGRSKDTVPSPRMDINVDC